MKERLKELREQAKMTQQQLADRSGVSRVTINRIETGAKVNIKTQTLAKLAEALDTKVGAFFLQNR